MLMRGHSVVVQYARASDQSQLDAFRQQGRDCARLQALKFTFIRKKGEIRRELNSHYLHSR